MTEQNDGPTREDIAIGRVRGRISLQMEVALREVSDEQLGALFREYIQESNRQSWDAWMKRDLRGVLAFFQDFMLFMKEVRDEPRGAGASLRVNSNNEKERS